MGKKQHPLLMQEMPLFFNRSFMLVRKLSGCYCSAGSQQIPQRCDAAALYPCNGHIIFLGCLDSTLHHLVGNGLGKQDHQIRRADLLFDRTGFFRKHLGIVAVGCTNVCILTAHSLVSADNYNTHRNSPLCCCDILPISFRPDILYFWHVKQTAAWHQSKIRSRGHARPPC